MVQRHVGSILESDDGLKAGGGGGALGEGRASAHVFRGRGRGRGRAQLGAQPAALGAMVMW